MLVNTGDNLGLPFLETRPRFSTNFSIHIFEGERLVQKWIKKLLSEGENLSDAKKLTKETFSEIRKVFGSEPMHFSHLRIGNNIFCYFENEEMQLINLSFNGHSAIKEEKITKRFYSGRGDVRDTFFWLFKEVQGEEKRKDEEFYSEFQEAVAGVPYLVHKSAGDGHPSDGNYSGGDG
jgi:hypothetical protein